MHLISPLASGIRGAEGGAAYIYARGTSTLVTYYEDFEASAALAQGSDGILLDEYGSVEVYVGQLVDVIVKDTLGSTVRQFTAGVSADSIEVISPSFMGVDYETGAVAANKPVTLSDLLDLWIASAGAVDFKTLVGGVSYKLSDILASALVTATYINVQSPLYGATGDGTTDDTAAIVAAIAAAASSGGGTLFFPPGSYLISTSINLGGYVNLLGAGAQCTRLKMAHATLSMFVTGSTIRGSQRIANLTFEHSFAGTGSYFSFEDDDTDIVFDSCQFGNNSFTKGISLVATVGTTSRCVVSNCLFLCTIDATAVASMVGASARFIGCTVKLTSPSFTGTLISGTYASTNGCEFYIDQLSSGSIICIDAGGSHTGNRLISPTSGAAIVRFFYSQTGDFVESGNNMTDPGAAAVQMYRDFSSTDGAQLGSRLSRHTEYTNNSDPITLDLIQYGVTDVLITNTASWVGNCQINTNANFTIYGQIAIVSFRNESGGAVTLEWNSGFASTGVTFAVANNSRRSFILVLQASQAASEWYPVADVAGATATT